MTAKVPKTTNATRPSTKGPYPFRTAWFLLLLGINFLVAAYYFHILV
ncbi:MULTISPECIES: photosystem I protein PsaX [Oscillatoriophycideae]|uniref:Photosystem I protein PsaX n=1 Tax=Aerosakkonema funiforme FACHB-1375 TaxID=2949571 RepID=A0A926VCA1_9CYAN|nr:MULTISPECIES: photosystem I protein PsaX [Oscillatoriales]MBD2180738.1 photosystem I protein PsaX [Aerosakkonema funiforme FACHB-1375]MBD3561656.1 photosystem I protein PsaX [Planktothrix sp. FACHB-1355]